MFHFWNVYSVYGTNDRGYSPYFVNKMMPPIMKRTEKMISGFISLDVLSHNVRRTMPKRTDEMESAIFMMCGMSFLGAVSSGMMLLWARVFIYVFLENTLIGVLVMVIAIFDFSVFVVKKSKDF